MEPVSSRGWAHADEVQAVGELQERRGTSGCERDRVCSVRVSVFPATIAKFLGGRARPPQGNLAAAAAAKSLQSCPTLCDPIGSPIPRILQARTLEWVAISCSNARK